MSGKFVHPCSWYNVCGVPVIYGLEAKLLCLKQNKFEGILFRSLEEEITLILMHKSSFI